MCVISICATAELIPASNNEKYNVQQPLPAVPAAYGELSLPMFCIYLRAVI